MCVSGKEGHVSRDETDLYPEKASNKAGRTEHILKGQKTRIQMLNTNKNKSGPDSMRAKCPNLKK